RDLVVAIDGTSNQFGDHNTNVVELLSRVRVSSSDNQRTYYNCGIGTYVPTRKGMFKYWTQRLDNTIDLAVAWNFKKIILKAYRWLSDQYQPGDKIFLFGFSRGAYQVRTLAGMIEKVGLVNACNQELIPFAYEVYSDHTKANVGSDNADKMANKFKKTFSRNIRIHHVGVWDTVSSVGIVRGKPLPLTSSAEHICIFRHALALDERRVKFLPEYVSGGASAGVAIQTCKYNTLSMSVIDSDTWFSGGGLRENLSISFSSVPLLWMENEATSAGLRLRPRKSGGEWNWDELEKDKGYESLNAFWGLLELLTIRHLTYKDADGTT
ncbi:hypothetical protein B0H16DRAFT_1230379, partial [Mycena metata]